MTVVRVLVITSGASLIAAALTPSWHSRRRGTSRSRRAQGANKHTFFVTERENKKRSEKVTKQITEYAARGGAFALVTPHESRPLSLSAAKRILYYCSPSSLISSLAFCFFIARFVIHFTPVSKKWRVLEGYGHILVLVCTIFEVLHYKCRDRPKKQF